MLAQLFRSTARLLNVRVENTNGSSYALEDEETFSIDINALAALPYPDFPWRRVAGICGQTIIPLYKSIQTMLIEDVENVVRVLYELDPVEKQKELEQPNNNDSGAAIPVLYPKHPQGGATPFTKSHHKLERLHLSDPLEYPLLMPSTHPSVPSILITPCPPPPRLCSSHVPLQDASYGNKLAVPGYPQLNSCVAPVILKPKHALLVERWKWRDGHWWAVIPDLEIQGYKGWFSRPVSHRRRAARPCRTAPSVS